MKKLVQALSIGLAIQLLFVGVVGAQYQKTQDQTISINTGLNLNVPLNTGAQSFNLQESIHHSLKSTTNLEVDHYYYWVEVDGNTILGVDPAAAMY